MLVCAAAAQNRPEITGFTRHGNRFLFQLREGAAELEWATPSTFRFRRTFAFELPARSVKEMEPVAVTVKEDAQLINFSTTFLTMHVRRDDLRITLRRADGSLLVNDLGASRRDGVISWERESEPGVRYYGLGTRTESTLNLRGMLVRDAVPFLISTAGYGEQYVAPGKYDFDLERLRRGRYRVDLRGTDTIDYYFYFGPTPKEIFEERLKVMGAGFARQAESADLRWMLEQSLTGIILPPQTVIRTVPAELRKRLDAYMGAYIQEVHDRGCPMLHPLPVQFPRDAEADKYVNEGMLGDELLVAFGRDVYLPQGIWTDLKTNEVTRGRQVVQTGQSPTVFARNGSIVPLGAEGTLELHYFPKLGAEFFLYEEDVGDYSQVHAAPAVDIMRLEIESKVARDYTWVVHHLEGVTGVTNGETSFARVKSAAELHDGGWYYDSDRKDLYVRVRVGAGQDYILSLSF